MIAVKLWQNFQYARYAMFTSAVLRTARSKIVTKAVIQLLSILVVGQFYWRSNFTISEAQNIREILGICEMVFWKG